MKRSTASLALIAVCVTGTSAGAQPRSTEVALRAGTIVPTESALYDAVTRHPRDPGARVALGRYLIARGATRVGMTLLEEAIRFGGDTAKIEPDLARAYLEAGEFHSLASLKSVAPGARQRAQWLIDHEPRVVAGDSILVVPFGAPVDSQGLGQLSLRIDGHAVDAIVSSSVRGIVISDTSAQARPLRLFPGDADRGAMLAVADSVGIGGVSMWNVPVMVERLRGPATAIIGLDVLGQFVPTFDPVAGQMTLHVGMSRVALPAGTRFVTWRATSELQLLQEKGWISVTRPSIVRVLRERRWTFDAARGVLVVEER